MPKFLIKKGTEILAINYKDKDKQSIVIKTIKKDVVYFAKDVQVDPVGNLGNNKNSITLGGQFARNGFYGFFLPKNENNYDTMLVHQDDVIAQRPDVIADKPLVLEKA